MIIKAIQCTTTEYTRVLLNMLQVLHDLKF